MNKVVVMAIIGIVAFSIGMSSMIIAHPVAFIAGLLILNGILSIRKKLKKH